MEVNNDFLIRMDSEAMQMCMSKKWGGEDKNLNEISYLDFRKRLYKKYYVEEEDV